MISLLATPAGARPAPREHRWGVRVGIDAPVRLIAADGSEAFGRVRNASISGALIETPLTLPVCGDLTVQFRHFELVARVTRVATGQLGVEWRDMACQPLVEMLHEAHRDAALFARDCTFD